MIINLLFLHSFSLHIFFDVGTAHNPIFHFSHQFENISLAISDIRKCFSLQWRKLTSNRSTLIIIDYDLPSQNDVMRVNKQSLIFIRQLWKKKYTIQWVITTVYNINFIDMMSNTRIIELIIFFFLLKYYVLIYFLFIGVYIGTH